MAQGRIVKVEGITEIKVLVNPFRKGDTIKIPSGATYTTTKPGVDGRVATKRNQSIEVFLSHTGSIDRYFDVEKSFPESAIAYSSERQNVLVGTPSISFAGTGGYWKDVELTEDIIAFNGLEPEYKVIGVFGEDGRYRDSK